MSRDRLRERLESVYGPISDEKFERVYRNTEIILKDREVRGIQVTDRYQINTGIELAKREGVLH